MLLEFELAGSQIDGARDYQEDAFLITHLTDENGKPSALVICADGMGGHAAGNVASNMAVQAFNKHVSANYPTDNLSEVLREAVLKTNASIKETVVETPSLSGMGCTIVATILEDGKITWVSVGDSHLYLIRNGTLTKKNADHSYGGFLDRMEAAGTPIKPEKGLSRNMLMSAITGEEINEIDIPDEPVSLEDGDRVLICSDGMDSLKEKDILQYSEQSESSKECADAFMKAVEEANIPRQDNTTAVIINVKAVVADPKLAADYAITSEQEIETFDEPKSKTGLFIGIATAIILMIGAGAFFILGDKKPEQFEPLVADTETESTVELIEEMSISEQETDTELVATEETSAEPAEKKTAQSAEEKVAEEKVSVAEESGSTFQDPFNSEGKGPVMVWVPEGDFKMGNTGQRNASPKHTVSIKKFAVSVNEITFAEYNQFIVVKGLKKPNTKGLDPKTFPAFFVSWDDAYSYTKWLSKETGKEYRLLSEAEWEYASSTGKNSPFWWGYNMEPGKAHCFLGCNQEFNTSTPMKTGSFEPNEFGLYDTLGNVAEWVHDCWHKNYKGAPDDGSVWEGGDCTQRVVRGGSFTSPEQSLTNFSRDKYKAVNKSYEFIGFRVARDK